MKDSIYEIGIIFRGFTLVNCTFNEIPLQYKEEEKLEELIKIKNQKTVDLKNTSINLNLKENEIITIQKENISLLEKEIEIFKDDPLIIGNEDILKKIEEVYNPNNKL